MPVPRRVKWKVCLIGETGVGKTSLIRRFVLDQFEDKYLLTLGTKVSKKEIEVSWVGRVGIQVDMAIWDIMGQQAFIELLKDAYFTGAHGILAVADLTRRQTLDELETWIRGVESVSGKLPMMVAVNKADLEAHAAFGKPEIEAFARAHNCDYVMTSAKMGQSVEDAFRQLATIAANRVVAQATAR